MWLILRVHCTGRSCVFSGYSWLVITTASLLASLPSLIYSSHMVPEDVPSEQDSFVLRLLMRHEENTMCVVFRTQCQSSICRQLDHLHVVLCPSK